MHVVRKPREKASPDAGRAAWRLPVRLRWIAMVILLPLGLVGLLALLTQLYGLVRYDPAYFAPAVVDRYDAPAEVGRVLEQALQTGDRAQLAELQGLRWPARVASDPNIRFVKLLERTDRYMAYLYVNMETYERHVHYLEAVRGRWVVAPTDFFFYLRSGGWREHFWPFSVACWLAGGLALGFVWLVRTSERWRAWLLGRGD